MKSINQSEHERINAREYPGTRQICEICDEPTGNCEDDSITCGVCGRIICENCLGEHYTTVDDEFPVCIECKKKRM